MPINVFYTSLVYLILPKNTKKHHCGIKQQINVTFRTRLTGLSVLLRNAIVIIFSRGVLQPCVLYAYVNTYIELVRISNVFLNPLPLRGTRQSNIELTEKRMKVPPGVRVGVSVRHLVYFL